jgi:glycosidase
MCRFGTASKQISYPFPSPADWRDCWIYFLMLDRFNNPSAPPKGQWNRKYGYRQGGTFNGVREKLGYIQDLGAKAIWLSPVLKNAMPADWEYNYHGYGIQDYLNLDPRFASDGTIKTAEREFSALVDEAHARGMHVVLDIVLNHSARVFDYYFDGSTTPEFSSPEIMNAPLGQEPHIDWIDGQGKPHDAWVDNIPAGAPLSPDDVVWPSDLQVKEFFRRRGTKLTDTPPDDGFVRGDFGSMRQLVVEYDASNQPTILEKYGRTPVLNILIRVYETLIAKYDIDAYRIDTAKYVAPDAVQTFGNAMREFASSIGKKNFFTFGEIYDQEDVINDFIGRHSTAVDGFGMDAALDFPTFYNLPAVAKGLLGVETVRSVFEKRKKAESAQMSSHGEAGKYFVTFLDNHDQQQRFYHPESRREQVSLGLAALFALQGIPCVYYGTEQGLQGTVDDWGKADLSSLESVREALWGKPDAFDQQHPLYLQIQSIAKVVNEEAALRYGRLYFRQISGNGWDFGHSSGSGGILAFSRILFDREVVIVANTNASQEFNGQVLMDIDLNRPPVTFAMSYSNLGNTGTKKARIINGAKFWDSGSQTGTADIAALDVNLGPMEVQIFCPQ